MNQKPITPLMKQYFDIKAQYPDALLLFQVGDFYELFYHDAKTAAHFLGITLTARGKHNDDPIPLCGVPVHALDYYLVKLIKGGFRVAICNQLQEAIPGKVVERGVTHVLTPGTLTDTKLLDEKSASYLCSFFPTQDHWGLLFAELLTAQLFATLVPVNMYKSLESELARFLPDEIIVPQVVPHFKPFFSKLGYCVTHNPDTTQDILTTTNSWLAKQFKSETYDIIHGNHALHEAFCHFYGYLKRNQEIALDQFKHINFYKPDDFLVLDSVTQRNLELIKNNHDGGRKNSLYEMLDGAKTAMGSRLIKKWIVRPLVKEETINQRLDAVQHLLHDGSGTQRIATVMMSIGDLERIIGRIALWRASLHDYLALCHALEVIPDLISLLKKYEHCYLLHLITQSIGSFDSLAQLLNVALNQDSSKDWIINSGFDQRLDYVREMIETSNQKVIALERQEQLKTTISSLKVRYNQVHGYYIEITKSNADLVPDYYIRHQTLVGKERFTIPELKSLEHEILTARNEIEKIETEVFDRIKRDVFTQVSQLRKLAHALAHLDALLGFAVVAYDNNYVRPTINHQNNIVIKDGRHPLVEKNSENRFIPNDTHLTDEQRLWIITGPNMGGKSTYLRQVALICIMAQCGSFVPANYASIPLIDRIFTRIGASDNLVQGKSTFLVEMEETALLCTQATNKSLVILDEVGRGTSTFDGLAIAQAVVEYIYNTVKARCLFATHYHELTLLEKKLPGIINYYAASKKNDNGILLLYKIEQGIANGSFGIEVAKLAQLPELVIERAQEIVQQLSNQTAMPTSNHDYQKLVTHNQQMQQALIELQTKLQTKNKVTQELQALDYDNLSPKQAFDLLWKLKEF